MISAALLETADKPYFILVVGLIKDIFHWQLNGSLAIFKIWIKALTTMPAPNNSCPGGI
jgi:hypothetical protein